MIVLGITIYVGVFLCKLTQQQWLQVTKGRLDQARGDNEEESICREESERAEKRTISSQGEDEWIENDKSVSCSNMKIESKWKDDRNRASQRENFRESARK